MSQAADSTRAGFVAVVGAPNAGKSTLINHLVGTKVSIVSHKVQTTRSRVLGIVMVEQAQVIFIDTPGIFQKPKRRLERAMVSAAWTGAADADLVCLLVDAERGIDDDSRAIAARLKEAGRPAVLALNKIDRVKREKLLALADELNRIGAFQQIFMVSALTGDGTPDLLRHFAAAVPAGPWLFPPDQLSDMPERMLAAEITREKVFHQLHQELPYSIAVETEAFETREDGSVRIDQVVYVLRENQRAIVLGKGGRKIKAVGAQAREELEFLLGCRVHLFLYVKVRDWIDDRSRYSEWGLDFET